jgi:hypothetical protein
LTQYMTLNVSISISKPFASTSRFSKVTNQTRACYIPRITSNLVTKVLAGSVVAGKQNSTKTCIVPYCTFKLSHFVCFRDFLELESDGCGDEENGRLCWFICADLLHANKSAYRHADPTSFPRQRVLEKRRHQGGLCAFFYTSVRSRSILYSFGTREAYIYSELQIGKSVSNLYFKRNNTH